MSAKLAVIGELVTAATDTYPIGQISAHIDSTIGVFKSLVELLHDLLHQARLRLEASGLSQATAEDDL